MRKKKLHMSDVTEIWVDSTGEKYGKIQGQWYAILVDSLGRGHIGQPSERLNKAQMDMRD